LPLLVLTSVLEYKRIEKMGAEILCYAKELDGQVVVHWLPRFYGNTTYKHTMWNAYQERGWTLFPTSLCTHSPPMEVRVREQEGKDKGTGMKQIWVREREGKEKGIEEEVVEGRREAGRCFL
jgi:hypothetical protein